MAFLIQIIIPFLHQKITNITNYSDQYHHPRDIHHPCDNHHHLQHYGVVPKGLLTFLGSLYKQVAKTTP